MSGAGRGLIWTTSPPSERDLRRDGFTVTSFREVRTQHIEPTRSTTSKRLSLENAAVSLLRLLDDNPRLAILGVPARTAGDLGDIYSFLVEPSFRRDVTLLLGVDRSLDELDSAQLTAPEMGYPWSLERLVYLAERYLRNERADGLPPLTPIEVRLLSAMRDRSLTPNVQFGIGRYRVDFAFPGHRLAVEADGRAWHDAERDASRDAHLETLGWKTLRFTGSEIFRDAQGATDRIVSALEERADIVVYTELPPEPRRSWWRLLVDWLFRRNRPEMTDRTPEARQGRPVPEWKAHLDHDQRRAVDAHEGVVQVIAPAGSGKTTTVITRVQELLARGVAANRIQCTTFNRTTRAELDDRLKGLGISGVEVRSFHALGRFILDQEGLLRSDIGSATYGQWRRISKQAMDSVDDGVWLDAPVASELVSNYKLGEMWDAATARRRATTPTERTAAAIYTLYEEYLEEASRNDFDDLILRAVQLLQRDPDARRRWQDRWECVLVDEYQDIEPAQELLIRLVAAPEDSIFAVGDEDQCIYSWRRASIERIVMLDTLYPGLDRVVLGTSYRCPATITDAARQLITNNKRRFPKEILPSPISPTSGEIETHAADSLSQGARQVAALLEGHAEEPGSVVVLARTSRLLREVVQACVERGVAVTAPARALRATDAEETVLAYLRLVSAPRAADAVDIRQSFRVPNRYLPQNADSELERSLRSGAAFTEAVAALRIPSTESWRNDRIREWADLCTKLTSAKDAGSAIRILRTDGGLDRHYTSVEQMSPHDQIEVEALEDLETSAGGVGLSDLVTNLELRGAALAGGNNEDAIELATIHGAKGREWDAVILFGADADQLPHFRTLLETESHEELEEALEDERRLTYVAITRTRWKLVVVTTSQPSPFLREAGIVPAAPELPTRQSIQAAKAAQEPDTASPTSKADRQNHQLQANPQPVPTATAKYPGQCAVCGGTIRPGNPIVRSDERWVHERCAAQ